jgi:hypothetical protein
LRDLRDFAVRVALAERKERQRLYEKTRDELATNSRLVAQAYDKELLALSSVFLGGSLAFTGQVVDLSSVPSKGLLYAAWICFVVTILLTLTSFLFTLFTHEPLVRAAERWFRDNDQKAWKFSQRMHIGVLAFSVVYGLTFLAAVSLLVIFVIVNPAKGEPKMSKNTSNAEWVEKSIPPGTFQPIPLVPVAPEAPAATTPAQEPSVPASGTTDGLGS